MTLIRIIFSDGTIFKVTFVGKTAISIQMLWLASQTFQLCHVSMLLCRLPESVVFFLQRYFNKRLILSHSHYYEIMLEDIEFNYVL